MSALLNVYTLSWLTKEEFYVNILACFGLAALIMIPSIVFRIIYVNHHRLDDPKFFNKYPNLIAELNLDSAFQYHFLGVFFMRRILFCAIILILSNNSVPQYIAMLVHQLAILGYVIIVKPFKPGLSKQLYFINEFLLTFLVVYVGIFIDPSFLTSSSNMMYGEIFIVIVVMNVAISWAAVMNHLIRRLI